MKRERDQGQLLLPLQSRLPCLPLLSELMMLRFRNFRLWRLSHQTARSTARCPRTPTLQAEPLEERLVCTTTPVLSLASLLRLPYSAAVNIDVIGPQQDNGRFQNHGSGVLIAPNWVLTAAHVLQDPSHPDPARVFVHAGQTRTRDANGQNVPYRPFGEAVMVNYYTPPQWSQSHDLNFDIALIELDRNLGQPQFAGRFHYGWLGDPYFTQHGQIHLLHYQHQSKGDFTLYAASGPATGLIASVNGFALAPSAHVITYSPADIDTPTGASGAPVYVTGVDLRNPAWGNVPTVVGVAAREGLESGDDNQATRITPTLFDWINRTVRPVIQNNQYTFPPKAGIDKPDVMSHDHWFGVHQTTSYRKDASGNLQITMGLWNGGTAAANGVKVSFFAVNRQNPAQQYPLPSNITLPVTVPPLNSARQTRYTWLGTVPASLPPGNYSLGYTIDPDHTLTEFTVNQAGQDNNRGTFDWLPNLVVTAPGQWRIASAVRAQAGTTSPTLASAVALEPQLRRLDFLTTAPTSQGSSTPLPAPALNPGVAADSSALSPSALPREHAFAAAHHTIRATDILFGELGQLTLADLTEM